ncbi:MAG: hypothetical protein ACRDUV_26075 [Pseudonocardiaceae bacterium]
MLDQFSPICGIAYRIDRFERGVGQHHEIRIFGEQLNPEPCMIGGCPEAIRLCICGMELRTWSIVALADEPETDDSSPEFGDRPGKAAVGRYSLLSQPLPGGRGHLRSDAPTRQAHRSGARGRERRIRTGRSGTAPTVDIMHSLY